MKLEQGQVWKRGDEALRIVEWSRLTIGYKATKDPAAIEGPLVRVTKKEFCRLLKGAVLVTPEKAPAERPTVTAPPARKTA